MDEARSSVTNHFVGTDGLDCTKAPVRTIPPGTSVRMTLGTDFPLIMTYDLADGDEHGTRMLAPRIRSDCVMMGLRSVNSGRRKLARGPNPVG